MIDEDFFISLPDDPEHAFPLYEAHIREILGERDENGWEWERQYVQYIKAFMLEYDFEIPNLPDLDPTDENFAYFYRQFSDAVGVKAKKANLSRLRSVRLGVSPSYILSPADKMTIHHYVDRIRSLIAEATLTPQKRDALVNRLNAFAVEVDRDRTRLDALTSIYVFAKREAKEELKPVFDQIEKIMEIFERAGEWLGLPSKDEKKQLPAPPKRIEGPKKREFDLDDEIPF